MSNTTSLYLVKIPDIVSDDKKLAEVKAESEKLGAEFRTKIDLDSRVNIYTIPSSTLKQGVNYVEDLGLNIAQTFSQGLGFAGEFSGYEYHLVSHMRKEDLQTINRLKQEGALPIETIMREYFQEGYRNDTSSLLEFIQTQMGLPNVRRDSNTIGFCSETGLTGLAYLITNGNRAVTNTPIPEFGVVQISQTEGSPIAQVRLGYLPQNMQTYNDVKIPELKDRIPHLLK